jgi:putative hydrolase of the HAD superfamily
MVKQKYSAIVFDLGNVLIPFDYTIATNKINKIQPNLGNRFIEYYKSNYEIHRNFESGKIIEEEFINNMLASVDNKLSKEEFCNYYSDIFSVNSDVVNLLPLLKKKYKLYLLSNTDPIHMKYGWQKHGFLKYFDKLILSFEVGAVKPEEKIYRAVEEASGFPSEKHFFLHIEFIQSIK